LIRIHILGCAAGGGLPQWNCTCANCIAARSGKIAPQTQSSIAISGDSEDFQRWFLINASPDLTRQIENMPQLQPHRDSPRNTSISGVFLTNADIDHALGLLLLRQQETPLVVYAADETRSALAWADIVLARFCSIEWQEINADFQSFSGGLAFRAIELPGSVAFQFRDDTSGATALFAPNVGELTEELRNAVHASGVVLFDGTFWTDGELGVVRPGSRTAREMNHLPISDGSLDLLRRSPARRKIYTHINNTNPILMPGTRERAQVEQAGIEIARDGLEITL
jgi:pyrroloquinoline quinone biosynthesis protein B